MSCWRSCGVLHVQYLSTTFSMSFPAFTSLAILATNISTVISAFACFIVLIDVDDVAKVRFSQDPSKNLWQLLRTFNNHLSS